LQPLFRLVPGQFELFPVTADQGDAPADATSQDFAPAATTILRVDAHRIDGLADTVGELVVATNALAVLAERADTLDPELALRIRAAQADLERAVGATSRAVSAVRLVSLAPSLRRLPRLVREIAAGLDKDIGFAMSGEHTEVDKQIADGLFEPLLHLVRNAIDHGIEDAPTRVAAGKPTMGSLTLAISRDGDEILVSLSDDGAGIDRARISATAIARELITSEAAETLSDAGILSLIFTPGFSTAAAITGVSGRGVGMDAVQAAIDRLRGRIEIDSIVGRGTRFGLRLPANAITTRLLVIEVASDRYAVPFDQIAETVRVSGDRLVPVGTGTACVLRDRTVPVLSLAELLGGVDTGALPAKLLVTRAGGDPVALRVDGFHERLDAMVRPPSGLLAGVPLVGGTTVMGDGAVMLVLNMAELVA
jgi:two-component system chemotaxis sensor kinase CheA